VSNLLVIAMALIAGTVAFNSDAVYLYSTRDEPGSLGKAAILPPNPKRRKCSRIGVGTSPSCRSRRHEEVAGSESRNAESATMNLHDDLDITDDSENETEDEDLTISTDEQDDVPFIYPRSRFAGHCNVETIKDGGSSAIQATFTLIFSIAVNFLGPYDEYVTSGSDDGNFFIWDKSSGELVDILEGDGSVVNVIEGHPTLPLIAVSGIDTTVKASEMVLIGSRSCISDVS